MGNNINGLSDSTLQLHDSLTYLRALDIILLTETRTAYIANATFLDHEISYVPASRLGAPGEGIVVLVRKQHAYHVQDWAADETSLWVIKSLCHKIPLLLGACYVPPSGSQNLRDNGADSRFVSLVGNILAAEVEGHVFVAGDMNARVGHPEDAACAQGRGCTNTVINAHGRQLISMCNSSDSLLCTGRAPGDESATFSYKSTARSPSSRIDHVVVSQSLYGTVLACQVNTHRPDSDHHPIECTLRLSVQRTQPQQCHGQPLLQRHWQPRLRADYLGVCSRANASRNCKQP